MKKDPKVFIIILNYNGKGYLTETLSSVFRLDYPNFEVIVVDNNSIDGSLEIAKSRFSKVVFIKNNQNLGFAAGNNIGIKYALERAADYILLLNNDTQVKNDFLILLIKAMEGDKKIGISSPLIFKNNISQVWFSGGKINWLKMKTLHKKEKLQEDYFGSDFISGCAMLIKSKVFKKVGLLDKDYFLYWEDVDFSIKTKKAGYKLLVSPRSQIYHFEKSENQKNNKTYWLVISGLLFFKKNTPFYLKPWIFIYILARKIKNQLDVHFYEKEIALIVQKAYHDFNTNHLT